MTRSGSGLTFQRRRILDRFDKKLADKGCTRDDMLDLEKALKTKLVAVDALGNTLWCSNKYNTHTRVTIPCHNNHAWSDIPTNPPQITKCHLVDREAESALATLPNVTKHDQKTFDRRVREILISFAARAISPNIRLWMCHDQLIGSDGTTWRSMLSSKALDSAFESETGADPQCDLPPELQAEYDKAFLSIGGSLSYRFQKWLTREDIKPTPEKFRAAWKASQLESKVWNSNDSMAGKRFHHHLDMRAAYLGCEDSFMGGANDAIELVR